MSNISLRTARQIAREDGIDLEKRELVDILVNSAKEVRGVLQKAWEEIPKWSFLGRMEVGKMEARLASLAKLAYKSKDQSVGIEEATSVGHLRSNAWLSVAESEQGTDFLRVMAELGVIRISDKHIHFADEVFLVVSAALPYLKPEELPAEFKASGAAGVSSAASLWSRSMLAKVALTNPPNRLKALEAVASRDIHLAAYFLAKDRDKAGVPVNRLSEMLLDCAKFDTDMEAAERLSVSMVGLGPMSAVECRKVLRNYGDALPRLLVAVNGVGCSRSTEDIKVLERIAANDDLGWAELRLLEAELRDLEVKIAPKEEVRKEKIIHYSKAVGAFALKVGVGAFLANQKGNFGAGRSNWENVKNVAKEMPPSPPIGGDEWLKQQAQLEKLRYAILLKVNPMRQQVPLFVPKIQEAATAAMARIKKESSR